MPQSGLCTDLTCDKDMKPLYECHCCTRLICLKHLIDHVEIAKQNQERLESLSNELITVTTTLKLIIEKKLLDIEYENKLIEQSNKLLQIHIYSVDEIQNIFQQINQAIALNRSEEAVVKVESSLLDKQNCSCVCKCNNEKNDQSLIRNTNPEPSSPIRLDLTNDTDEGEKLPMTKSDEYPVSNDHEFIYNISIDQTTDDIKDEVEDGEEEEDDDDGQNKVKATAITTFSGLCPLTFDGAYGLTRSNHSIRLCSNKKVRPIGLYAHFVGKHEFKCMYARRLVKAIATNQDPRTTKIFDESEDIINHFYRVPCPFNDGLINLSEFNKKINISRVPCRFQSIIFHGLKFHLKRYHHISDELAQTLVKQFKENRMKNNIISS